MVDEMIIVGVVLVVVIIAVWTIALCKAAAREDRRLERCKNCVLGVKESGDGANAVRCRNPRSDECGNVMHGEFCSCGHCHTDADSLDVVEAAALRVIQEEQYLGY